MSRLNAFRVVNLNYNNNAIRVDDELWQLNSESTLLSLRNGGGKTVLVQMMTALFVHKRYRNTKDRPFSSYFTTNKPTFLMVEWALDDQAGYVLTGMMVREHQAAAEENDSDEELDMVNFICEYNQENSHDIRHLPIITQGKDGKKLKSFSTCKELFQQWKNDKSLKFFAYDMNQAAQSRAYFNQLEEYQIYYKEWENIICKINAQESGLSNLFADCKDERGLIEKWFLDAVETKLDKNGSRIKEFIKLTLQYVQQYKENQSKIEKKALIERFGEDALVLQKAAENFAALAAQGETLANAIAWLREDLAQCIRQTTEESEQIQQTLEQLQQVIWAIKYDKQSWQIYLLEDEQEKNRQIAQELEDQLYEKKRETQNLARQIAIQECAKRLLNYREASEKLQYWENQLLLLDKEAKDLQPRREQLGYTLRCRYQALVTESKAQLQAVNDALASTAKAQQLQKAEEKTLHQTQNEQAAQRGRLQEQMAFYDQIEQNYNRRFDEQLARNLLGEYETGLLEIAVQKEKASLQTLQRQIVNLQRQREDDKEQQYALQREQDALWEKSGQLKMKQAVQAALLQELQAEMTVRRTLLEHVDLSEDKLLETEEIIAAFQKRLDTLQEIKRQLLNQQETLTKEYRKLENGQFLELPPELAAALDDLGCHYLLGMEWLKKNGFSPTENQAMVEANPFIPYSLLMSRGDFLRLQNIDIAVAFPVPIVLRESLTKSNDAMGKVRAFDEQIGFYVWFDQTILDEAGLQNLLAQKQAEREKVHEQQQRRQSELEFYQGQADIVKGQRLNKTIYTQTERELATMTQEALQTETAITQLRQQLTDLAAQMKANEETLVTTQREGRFQQEKLQALEELVKAYERYRQACQEEVRLQAEDKRLQEQLTANLTQQKRLQTDYDELQDARRFRQEQLQEQQKKLEQYASFEPRSLLEKDLEDMESEFQVLSQHISMERQQLEQNITRERQSFDRIDEDLLTFSKANGLISSDYETVCYDSYRLDGLKEDQIQLALAMEHLREQQHQCEIAMTKIETQLSYELRQLQEQLDTSEPRARELVTVVDFDALLTTKQHQQQTIAKTLQSVQNRQGLYQENLSALAEFAHLPLGEILDMRQDLTLLNREQLDCHRGQLVRDYRAVLAQGRDERENLSRLTESVLRRGCYQEDFFHKPLLTLADLTAKPQDYLTQLAITRASYEQLLQKLAVDIQLIEKEKEKVLELFLRYLSDVHQQLGLIDKNSTIRVKERSLKMLRLELPDWAENEAVYTAKLKNYLENITEQCLILLADNQNVEDLLSRQIALRQLYDAVVGIGNIEIKLYKIEAQREYPIRWADVARNSGGEGFLSAFVILSSLLSFLRRKESDLFGEREESKVLVMDNPFAQTNAAHLLIPMMDMAKKTHTQLICLSGIGGDAIYGRFDNIYVLTPVQSGLQRELSYLRGEHVKGETLISAQIQTEDMEQITLF